MPDEVETTPAQNGAATASPPANAVPATPPADVDKLVKAAVAQAQREAQASKDREQARLHRQYQQQIKQLTQAATARLKNAGDEQADAWEGQLEVLQKARAWEESQAEQAQWQQWKAYVADIAVGYGLAPDDARLADATSADDLKARAKAALVEDVEKERRRLLEEDRKARKTAADQQVESGNLATVPGGGGLPPLALGLEDQYKKEMLAARGKGMDAGRAIKDKYRAKGVNVEAIRLV